ncbi:UDP-N-acetylglucosamine diphosphorylase 1 [Acorus calamus]|uniref:UDP-N-acetylglucosamine diphosphorylase 1 n=1 Tax=Acorus calamus TaxID=4465 RepID=A0AAV9E7N2_ACOCL|nr:UDP-N-acetylglucosamine diphosphorylase 1 [Acorus calamus]
MKELMVVSEVTTNGVGSGGIIIGAAAATSAASGASATPPQDLRERVKDYGQDGVFALWDELSLEERDFLIRDIRSLDLARIDRIIRCSFRSQGVPTPEIEPVPETSVSKVEERTMEERARWWKMGLKAISEGRLGVLLLSGGQGIRLGSSDPKGCFSIGLPSGKSLFQLQAERILRIQRLAAQSNDDTFVPIHWYIMTSPFTDDATRKFFESHGYFGLDADQVTFFQQGTLPCVSKDGRFIMETPNRLARAPDGNGGVYSALKSSKLLEDMAKRGVRYIDCYGVDNALVRVADPTFLGYFIDKGVASAAKVVRKAYPQEKVGVFVHCGRGGPLAVLEYSEMDPSMTLEINQTTGRLRFCWSNVCLHMFTLDFLNQVAHGLEKDSIYHLAEKKIPSVHGHTMGWKLEQFIFDAFTYSPSTALFEVLREEEFAPVKNANGSTYDTPDSARLLVLRLHSRWVVAAGGFLTHSVPLYATGVEVSPLVSYTGENLEAICRGRTFHAPCEITY